MQDIKIITGEPFKTKVLKYSHTKMNEVVAHNMTLYKVNENVYLSEGEKCEYNHKENDMFTFVLKIKHVFIQADTFRRRNIENSSDIIKILDKAAVNYIDNIGCLVNEKKHIGLIHIKVFEALGLDTNPLWDVRKERECLRQEKKRQEEALQKERQAEAERKEEERLKQVKQQFRNNEYIDAGDFLTLCKKEGLDIHIRTKGIFNKSVNQVNISGSIIYRSQKGKHPNFDGCFKAIAQYKTLITIKSK
jgi:hypothetical protein